MTSPSTTPNDTTLRENVLAEISFDPAIKATTIEVTSKGGTITLAGTVTSYAEQICAEEATKRVAGVHGLKDQLTVALPTSYHRSESDILTAITEALIRDVTVPNTITATVSGGFITLTGEAQWQYEITNALRCAQFLTGVCGLTNTMVLKPPQSTAYDIAAQLARTFARNATISSDKIKIEITGNSNVTLRGTVHSLGEHDETTRAAYCLPGVHGVQNLTRVG